MDKTNKYEIIDQERYNLGRGILRFALPLTAVGVGGGLTTELLSRTLPQEALYNEVIDVSSQQHYLEVTPFYQGMGHVQMFTLLVGFGASLAAAYGGRLIRESIRETDDSNEFQPRSRSQPH